ncbi:MAG: HAMP domain-containing histidine kinase [Rhizobiales bacterium]|nr:HAMP domain-containing histidine kinase [Hyphomicrobiales bacterium]
MTALGKLVRTTAFKLSFAYLLVFALFAGALLVYFAWTTRALVTSQIAQTVEAEITGLAEQYRQAGIRRLVLIVDTRSRRPGSSLYLVTTATGEALAGNVGSLPPGTLERTGLTEITYHRPDEADESREALVRVFRLENGFRLLVGRDLEERERLHNIITTAGHWSIALVIVLGLVGGFFITRRVLKRVDAMTATTQTIMAGNFGGRLPVAGTGDEFDRLADNLNVMLARIEALMRGLEEVSDNIAHDLKTPLTRLRNHAEEALRTATNEAAYRDALVNTIEESDGLIRTFNALLMIARAESGHTRETFETFDATEIVRDICELYEPLAEENGLRLKVITDTALPVRGNRELVSQALSNLMDNAIKYAAPCSHGDNERAIAISATGQEGKALVAVADSGPGIPAEDRMRATERFVRLESSRTKPGSGLGLSLVAAVARLHDGELQLADNNPGLVATIVLPLAPRAEP